MTKPYFFTHASFLEHAVAAGHPERPDRLRSLLSHCEETGLLQDFAIKDCPPVDPAHVAAVHTTPYIEHLQALSPRDGLVSLDADTSLGPASLEAASRAAGAAIEGVRACLDGLTTRAFCAVRPPGHHAESDAGMGFCLYNSVAIAARWALDQPGVDRVAILDFDVHHANGTVEIFQDDPRVLVCSSFQYPFYPGRYDDVERENIVLTPLAAGSSGAEFRDAVSQRWFPAIEAHAPQLVLVSAGFDAHRDDPLGGLNLVETDFQWITQSICQLAADHADGRVVSLLEGGYDLNALARSVVAHLKALKE